MLQEANPPLVWASTNTSRWQISWVTSTELLSWLVQVQPPRGQGETSFPKAGGWKKLPNTAKPTWEEQLLLPGWYSPWQMPFSSKEIKSREGKGMISYFQVEVAMWCPVLAGALSTRGKDPTFVYFMRCFTPFCWVLSCLEAPDFQSLEAVISMQFN